MPTGYLTHLKSPKVGRQVVLLEGGWVKGDGVGQVDLPAFDLWHHVHQVQYLVRPFVSVGSVKLLNIFMEFDVDVEFTCNSLTTVRKGPGIGNSARHTPR